MNEHYEDPEKRKESSDRAKAWWGNYPANITVKNIVINEIVVLTTTSREFCKQRDLNYRAFHLLKKGKIKSTGKGSNVWILGTEIPIYVDRKGEKRKSLSNEAKRSHANGKYEVVQLIHIITKNILIIGYSLKEFSIENDIRYSTLINLMKGKVRCSSCCIVNIIK